MASTTISGLNPTLQAIKSMKVAVDRYDDQGLPVETNNLTLEQILELFEIIGNAPPTGTISICPSDTVPAGYLELNGDPFDMALYPQLALVFPSGILPKWNGRTPKHTPDGAVAGTTEEDNIKVHSHSVAVQNKDLGAKNTNSAGEHSHTKGGNATAATNNGYRLSAGREQPWTQGDDTTVYDVQTQDAGNHVHSMSLGSHNHTATCSEVGSQENTVKGVFVRYVVRAR